MSTVLVFGQEKSTEQDQFIHFEPLPYQDTTNLQWLSLGEISNLCLQVTERGTPYSAKTLDPAKIIFHVFTRHDQEGFEGGVNFRFLGSGGSTGPNTPYTFFQAVLPAVISADVAPHNGTIELTGIEDDYLIVRYVSPFTGVTVLDTVVITKNI
ncbi:MAG TPA: hypothetical protein VMF59_00205 [Bacteroidota bacterium]|nr:hypothetical protein [Bacteroidota bacterium]